MNISTRVWTTMPIVPWPKLWFHPTAPSPVHITHNNTTVKATQHIINIQKGAAATSAPLVLSTRHTKRFGHFWPPRAQYHTWLAQAKDAMLLCKI
jgi:hypothetical protein